MGTDIAPDWSLLSRDTIIYDAAGHEILSMSSRAQSGWSRDSLSALDSTIYSNGKIGETVSKYFYSFSGTLSTTGYRSVIAYLNNNKVIVTTDYDWNDLTQTWRPSYKDSAVFSAATDNATAMFSDLTNLTCLFSWDFDTTSTTWKSTGYYIKISGECTATTFVLAGKEQSSADDSLVDTKIAITFSSPVWTEENMVQQIMQQKESAAGSFVNVSKYVKEVNASGYLLGYKNFDWDADLSAWIPSYISLSFPDAHGNDTFYLSADYDAVNSVWDTTGMDRYVRTYDAKGNNTVILASSYSSWDESWSLSEKTVNTFSQIPMAAKRTVLPIVMQNIAVKISPTVIAFSGRNIEGVDLFNASGRLVSSVNQKPAEGLLLNLTGNGASIPAGIYIAELRTASGKCPVRFSICR